MMKPFAFISVVAAIACLSTDLVTADSDGEAPSTGAVYTMDNSSSGNNLVVFSRAADGELRPNGTIPTEGSGTGHGLGSEGAILLSRDGLWLFVCNAGSD